VASSTLRVGRIAAAVAALAVAASAAAQESASGAEAAGDGERYELGEVTVTAARVPAPSAETPPAVSVVTAADIAARGASTVAEALETVVGLSLNDKGPRGSQISVSLRGSTTNQVLVLIDGVRVNEALSGLADLSRLSVENIERIEVVRGAGSSLHGADAVGGVVNIITKKSESPLVVKVELGGFLPAARVFGFGFAKTERGADAMTLLDSQRLGISWTPRVGEALASFSLDASRAGNSYTFIDANDEKRAMENAGLLGAEIAAGIDFPLFDGKLSAKASGCYQDKGVPGSESAPTLRASEHDMGGGAVLRYSAERFLSDYISIEAALFGDWSRVDYENPDQPDDDARHDIATFGFDTVQRAFPAEGLSLTYGLSISYASADSDTVGRPRRLAAGAFLSPSLSLGDFTIAPSIRYDFYSDFSTRYPLGGLAAALGLVYRASEDDTFKLNASRAYRVPSFNDLYWPAIAGAEGNPDLEPEEAFEANLGYEHRRKSLAYTAVAYARYSRGVILWQPGDDGVWRPTNFGDALYPGIEQELKAELSPNLSVSASYSYLHSFVVSGSLDLADDRRLPMTPVHSLKAVVSGSKGPLSWSATATYASLRYLKTANAAYLPAYFTMDAMLRLELPRDASIFAAADNLFDEQYQIIEGYPMPGTRIRIGYEMKLKPKRGKE
jgi:outer membrane cobalamin receptor